MKVEHHGPGAPTARTDETAKPGEAAAKAPVAAAAAAADTVSLSSDLQLVRAAVEQANAQPEIRTEVVQRMRQLIERGELGQDAETLADAMIDRWLNGE